MKSRIRNAPRRAHANPPTSRSSNPLLAPRSFSVCVLRRACGVCGDSTRSSTESRSAESLSTRHRDEPSNTGRRNGRHTEGTRRAREQERRVEHENESSGAFSGAASIRRQRDRPETRVACGCLMPRSCARQRWSRAASFWSCRCFGSLANWLA